MALKPESVKVSRVAELVVNHGLGHVLEVMLDAESIEPGPLQEEWGKAQESMRKIRKLLPPIHLTEFVVHEIRPAEALPHEMPLDS